MQEQDEGAPPQDVLGLSYGEHLLVWTLRRVVARRGLCPVIVREFADACGEEADEVLATFRVFVEMLGHSARRPLSIGYPGYGGLTGNERQILSLVAAAQRGDGPRLEALLCWLARIELRPHLAVAVRALATAFAAHDLALASPSPAMTMRRSQPPRLWLVS
jgi:hypothetical protein